MNRDLVIQKVSEKLKLVRVEADYTQDKMAEILGISKKTLVQIEKGRALAGWTVVLAVCALFRDSEIVQSILGEDPIETIETMAHEDIHRMKEKTLGGKVWWRLVDKQGVFTLQQNVLTKHFRIIDHEYYRFYSSFDEQSARNRLNQLANKFD